MASRQMTPVQDNALHYYRRSSSYDADAEDDDDEDVNASLLPGMPIRAGSVVSIMNSSSILSSNDDTTNTTTNSMMYSEDERGDDDDDDDDGSASDLSSVASISSSSTIHYNPTTITSGVFLNALDDASSFGSSSEESSLFSHQDHYFSQGADDTERTASSSSGNAAAAVAADGQEPALLLSQSRSLEEKLNINPLGEDRNSRSFEEYIFSDDDGSTGSSTTTQRQELMPKDEKGVSVSDMTNKNSVVTDKNAAPSITTGFFSKSQDSNANNSISPETWQHYNEERGRRMARQMLSRANNDSTSTAGDSSYEVDTASMALEEEQHGHGSPSPRLRHSNEQPQRRHSSFLGRVFFGRGGKRFTRSLSPLDAKVQAKVEGSTSTSNTTPVKYNPHRVSDLAVSAALQQKEGSESPSSSAGDKRNCLVDFEAWEAALAAAHQQRMNHSPSSVIPEGEDVEGSSLRKGANGLDHRSEHASVDFNDDDDEKSVLFIKSVSLTAQDFIPKRSFSPSLTAPDMRLGLEEARSTSEDIAVALDMQEDEALELLTHIRGRAGIIEDLGSDTGNTMESSHDTNVLPWIHLQDNVWMPHYEEYVVRAVHLFQRRMMETMAAATPDASSTAATTTHS